MPECLSKQLPRSNQEYDGEHEQSWHEHNCPASQVVYHVNNWLSKLDHLQFLSVVGSWCSA